MIRESKRSSDILIKNISTKTKVNRKTGIFSDIVISNVDFGVFFV